MAEQVAPTFFDDIQNQFQVFFQNLNLSKKIFLFATIAAILLGLAAFIYYSQQVTWTTLASGIDQQDAGRIVEKLKELNIEYRLQSGGSIILVPASEVDNVRLQVASSGLQIGNVVGLESFEKNDFGATEFQQKVQYKRALEGELTRLITKINIIDSAKISIAIPEKSLFLDQERNPTASVVLELANSRRLSEKGVNTILNLVSGAVAGMATEDVRIADQSGNLLSKGANENAIGSSRDKNYAYQQFAEQRLEQKLLTQLESIAGKDRVKARVSLLLDFDSSVITEDIVDPDGSAVLSEEINTEKSTGSRSIPVGVPGVTSNSPEVRAGASEIANVADTDKKGKRVNYVNSRTQVTRTKAAGNIIRMSVAVLIDGRYEYKRDENGDVIGEPAYEAWAPEDIVKIEKLAKQAVGFDAPRGDSIEVKNIRFRKPLEEQEKLKQKKNETRYKFIVDLVRYVVVGLIIIMMVFLVIRPMVQKLSAKPEDLDLLMGLPTTIGELEGEELEIPTEKDTGIPARDKIIEIARSDPLKTASLVRTWLREKKGP